MFGFGEIFHYSSYFNSDPKLKFYGYFQTWLMGRMNLYKLWTFGDFRSIVEKTKGLDMGKGREMRRTRGEGELDPGRQLENRSEGVTRRVSLVCSC